MFTIVDWILQLLHMLKTNVTKERIPQVLLGKLNRNSNATAKVENIFKVSEQIVSVNQGRRWIKKFRVEN